MSAEWACEPRFHPEGIYSRDDFAARCRQLMGEVNDGQVRYLLSVYAGWAGGLSYHDQIQWLREPNGSMIPCVRRGGHFHLPDGKICDARMDL